MRILAILALCVGALAAAVVGFFLAFDYFCRENRPDQSVNEPREHFEPAGAYIPDQWRVVSSRSMVLDRIFLPFLHRRLIGRQVLVKDVEGRGIMFTGAKREAFHNTVLKRGKIRQLKDSGQLLRIELFGEDPTKTYPGQMDVSEAEEYYLAISEIYTDLAAAVSEMPISKVLNTIYDDCFDEVEKSQRLEAAFVVETRKGKRDPAPVWVVNFYGFPPTPRIGVNADEPGYSHMRYVLDAKGRVLQSDTLP